jgi:AraC-like DNA-binding protein
MRDLPKPDGQEALAAVDPLSDLLTVLRARCELTASLEAGGDWSLRFGAYEPGALKFSAVVRGQCWLQVEGSIAAPAELQTGDCVLLNGAPGYTLASDLALPSVDAREVFAAAPDRRARYGTARREADDDDDDGDGDESTDLTHLIGGKVSCDEGSAGLLLDSLPTFVIVQHGSEAAAVVRWVLQQLAEESRRAQVGTTSVTAHLAHLLFVQMLRAHLAAVTQNKSVGGHDASGWLGAAAHPRIGKALGLMHSQPAHRWTLDALAAAANMSRSTFSGRFKSMVGRAPMDYLLHWRMQLALRALREGRDGVAAIAFDAGYESESAFSNAFKRVVGQSPAHYRRSLDH